MAALTGGFLLVASAFMLLGPSLTGVIAEEDNLVYLKLLRAERGHNSPRPQAASSPGSVRSFFAFPARPEPRRPVAALGYAADPRPAALRPLVDRAVTRPATKPYRFASPMQAVHEAAASDAGGGLSRRSVCVRLCDGYHHPVGDYHGPADNESHGAICAGMCPGAPTRLYVVPNGSEKIEDAVSVRDNRSYRSLPVAFRYASQRDKTCSCRGPGDSVAQSVSLLKDFTLRRGDRVMTEKGFKIFRGAASLPYRPSDFVGLSQAHEVTARERGSLDAMERASGVSPREATPRPKTVDKAAPQTPISSRMIIDANGKTVRLIGPQAMLTQSLPFPTP